MKARERYQVSKREQEKVRISEIAETFAQLHIGMVGKILTMLDRETLTLILARLPEYFCDDTVFMLLPAQTEKGVDTLVLGMGKCCHIGQSPLPILDSMTRQLTNLYDFKEMRNFWAIAFGKQNLQRVPFACRDFSLVPLGRSTDPLTIWVNPVVLVAFMKETLENGLMTKLGFAVPTKNKTVKPILERIEIGAIAQGLMMSMEHTGKPQGDDLLFDYLGYNSDLLEAALGSKKINQLPLEQEEVKYLMGLFRHIQFTAAKVKTEVVSEDLRQQAKKRLAEVAATEKKEKDAKNQGAKQEARERKAKQQKKAKQKAKKQTVKKQGKTKQEPKQQEAKEQAIKK